MLENRNSIRGLAVASSAAVAVAGLTVGINVINARADEPAVAASRAPVAAATGLGSTMSAHQQLADIQTVAQKEAERRRAAEKRLAEKRRKAAERREAEERAAAARQVRERASRSSRQSFSGDVRGIAAQIAQQKYGWDSGQFSCLNSLWEKESGWNYRASNPSSGAYGIPQALPGSKMSSFGSDWQTNPATQIKWGLDYIDDRYGSPCGAWSTAQSQGWY